MALRQTVRLHPDRSFETIACAHEDALQAMLELNLGRRGCFVTGDYLDVLMHVLSQADRGVVLRTLQTDKTARLNITALRGAISEALAQGAVHVAVDNTWATSYLVRPLQMGAHLVVLNCQPWLGVEVGVVIARSDDAWNALVATCAYAECPLQPLQISFEQNQALLGALRTLALRVQRSSDTALALAHYAAAHPLVSWVSYPGLAEDSSYDAAHRTLEHGSGAYLSFGLTDSRGACALSTADDSGAQDGFALSVRKDGYDDGPRELVSDTRRLQGPVIVVKPEEAARWPQVLQEYPTDQLNGPTSDRTAVVCSADGSWMAVRAGLESPLDVVAELEQLLMQLSHQVDAAMQ